jgi:phage tail sheath gpL-like
MPISFNYFPANWRMPLYWVEVDPSKAGLPVFEPQALLVGHADAQALSDTETAPNTPIPIGNMDDATRRFGAGSMLEAMFRSFFANNFAMLVFGLPIPEPTAGVAASGTIKVTAAPTIPGTFDLYIAGQHISVGVQGTDTEAVVASAIADTINATVSLPVTAEADSTNTDTVNLTCKWKGITGNDINLRDNYLGKRGGQEMPIGMAVTYSGTVQDPGRLTGGTGVPTFTDAIINMGDEPFEYVALPFTDTGSYMVWGNEFDFRLDTGRWGWMRQLFGIIFSAYRGKYAESLAWGQYNNSGMISTMSMEWDTPSTVWEVSAAYASKAGRALLNDPARPLQTLELTGILPAAKENRWIWMELNALAGRGLATQRLSGNNVPMIMRDSTNYQRNVYGIPDDALELVTTLATLATIIRNQRQMVTSKYPRHKLADDGTLFGPGQAIVTPKIIKGELCNQYAIDEYNGLVENLQAFKDNLIVERNINNPNRLDVLWPPDLVNQLRIFAVLAQYRLQYNRGVDYVISQS